MWPHIYLAKAFGLYPQELHFSLTPELCMNQVFTGSNINTRIKTVVHRLKWWRNEILTSQWLAMLPFLSCFAKWLCSWSTLTATATIISHCCCSCKTQECGIKCNQRIEFDSNGSNLDRFDVTNLLFGLISWQSAICLSKKMQQQQLWWGSQELKTKHTLKHIQIQGEQRMIEMILMVVNAPQLPSTMHTRQGNIIYALILKALRINTSKCTTYHFLKLFEDMGEQPSF